MVESSNQALAAPAGAPPIHRLEPIGQPSMVVAAAAALRREILRRAEDDMFLGSEDDLVARLGVSQPTFRQAARLLESEELLTVRRGVGGGYFGRRPSAEVVANMAGTYLLSRGVGFADVVRTQAALQAEIIRQIAANPEAGRRSLLLACIADQPDLAAPRDIPAAVRAINRFWRLAADLAGNPSLGLFLLALQSYGAHSAGLTLTADRVRTYVAGLSAICAAIERGDVEAGLAAGRSSAETMIAWTLEDARVAPGNAPPMTGEAP